MNIEDRTYYEEEQKMQGKWILVFILISSISALTLAVSFLYSEHANWTLVSIIAGSIVLTDAFAIIMFRSMKLQLALTKKGLHYHMVIVAAKDRFLDWAEVETISIRKAPTSSYGKHYKFRYGEVYTMNLKRGVEFSLKNGKKKFFSLQDPEEFIRSVRKLELNVQIL